MITTADGAIDVDGRSRPLGGPADQQHLVALRSRASVVMVGAGTIRAEPYGPPSRMGLRIGVVTRSCDIDFSSSLFTSGAGFVMTALDSPQVPVDSIRAGTGDIDLAGAIAQLPHGTVHVEGGPHLNAALLSADLVDAINLTFSPWLTGARGVSIAAAPHIARRFSLAHQEVRENFVFARYERTTTASATQARG